VRWFALLLGTLAFMATNLAFGQDKPIKDYKSLVEASDENQDGHVDRVEFLKHMTDAFFFVDIDKDGYITLIEIRQAVEKTNPEGFNAADRNNDGKLSMYEFQEAIDQDFDQADKNNDGRLSQEEMKEEIQSAR
jgi:Ca2+-binding EF-hand superfamily protein